MTVLPRSCQWLKMRLHAQDVGAGLTLLICPDWVRQMGDNLLVDACGHTKSRLSCERKLGHASLRSKQLLLSNDLGPRPKCT